MDDHRGNPRLGNMCFQPGLLTADGAETVHDTTQVIEVTIDGVFRRKTAITDGATPTTDGVSGATFTALAADQTCWFIWCLDAALAVKVVQGEIKDVDGDEDVPLEYPGFPDIPLTLAPFAIQRVQTAGTSSAWTFGASNWNATGVTDLILNVASLPRRVPTTATA